MTQQIRYKAVLFDLDGTLLDTLDDLTDSVNAVLSSHGYQTHDREAYRYFVGDGIINLILRALPSDRSDESYARSLLPEVDLEYEKRWNIKSAPYEGIRLLLKDLASRNLKLAVLSNKPHPFTTRIVSHFFPDIPFQYVYGARDGVPRKPDPSAALDIAKEMKIDPSLFLYVGDTNTDMKTAFAAGMYAVGVAWGFRPVEELVEAGANMIIKKPEDLLSMTLFPF